MIRLIATDLDGTLLEKDGKLPQGFFDVAASLLDQGIAVAAASGRQYDNLRRLFSPIAHRMSFICENGGLCATGHDVVAYTPIDKSMVMEAIEDLHRFGLRVMVSGVKCCYMLDNDRSFTDDIIYRLGNTAAIVKDFSLIDEPIIKFSGFSPVSVAPFAKPLMDRWSDRLSAVVAGVRWFDFTLANKGIGLQNLMNSMGIKAEEVVAFGDQFNDESMLDIAGHPYLMRGSDTRLYKPGTTWCDKVLPVLEQIAKNGGEITAS